MYKEEITVETIIQVISNNLLIRYQKPPNVLDSASKGNDFIIKDTPKSVKEELKSILTSYIDEKTKELEPTDTLEFSYYFGMVRSKNDKIRGSYTQTISSEMAEVLEKLPKLPEGEEYYFPYATSVRFKLNDERIPILDTTADWILTTML